MLTFAIPNISIGGHLGGLLGGVVLAFVLDGWDDDNKPGAGTVAAVALSVFFFVASIWLAGAGV